ncbi:BA75_00528T0 [Komagataella pastoris]|uniref:BA75_00528T0 n=1 Tax=Komagataella pastoris TaxID=4922 RepID=A0A1B2JA03_PICPA|nr:BA75_00528T0 [Komagataella pastoris]
MEDDCDKIFSEMVHTRETEAERNEKRRKVDRQFNIGMANTNFSEADDFMIPSFTESSDRIVSQRNFMPSSPPRIDELDSLSSSSPIDVVAPESQPIPMQLTFSQLARKNLSSEDTLELDIDNYGRVSGVRNGELYSTSPTKDHDMGHREFLYKDSAEAQREAVKVLRKVFDEDNENKIDLERFGLTSIPDEFEDFKDSIMVNDSGHLSSPQFHVFLGHNHLSSLSHGLFQVPFIDVLSLRFNRLTRIPGNIKKLTQLRYLALGNNNIVHLPHSILKLDKLQVFSLRPNPLKEPSEDDIELTLKPGPRYVSRVRWSNKRKSAKVTPRLNKAYSSFGGDLSLLEKSTSSPKSVFERERGPYLSPNRTPNLLNDQTTISEAFADERDFDSQEQELIKNTTSFVPRLTELALRCISNYRISISEAKQWKKSTSKFILKMASKALIQGTNGESCGSCENIIIEPIAAVYEWWDIADAKNVPIRRHFCSKMCVNKWESTILEMTNGPHHGERIQNNST